MDLCGIYHTQYAEVTSADAEKLAEVLDLTADTGAPVTSGGAVVAGSGDTAFLIALYRRALDAVERHTGRIMRPCALRIVLRAANESAATLPVFPVTSVTGVTVGGEALTGWTAAASPAGTVVTLPASVTGDVTVDVTAGYAAPLEPPPTFEAAVLSVAADMYEHREAQSEVNLYENRQLRFVLADLKFYNCG